MENKRIVVLITIIIVIVISGITASMIYLWQYEKNKKSESEKSDIENQNTDDGLTNSQKKSRDARIKSYLQQLRTQAEIVYDDNGSYDNVATDSNVIELISNIKEYSNDVKIYDSADDYAAEAQLVTDPTDYYCIDSTGNADKYSGSTIDSNDFECGN